jgi:hypothetical protein
MFGAATALDSPIMDWKEIYSVLRMDDIMLCLLIQSPLHIAQPQVATLLRVATALDSLIMFANLLFQFIDHWILYFLLDQTEC